VAALAFIGLTPAIAIAMVALARGGRCSTALIVAQAPLAVALLPAALSLDADPVARPDADTGRWAMVVVFGEGGRYADTQHDGSEGEHRKSTRGKAFHSDLLGLPVLPSENSGDAISLPRAESGYSAPTRPKLVGDRRSSVGISRQAAWERFF